MDKVLIFDTTLRDGEQSLASSLSGKEKIKIARQLARLKVDIIEAGFPVSSPGDFESVETIARQIKGPVICGLARAVDKDITTCADALKPARNKRIHTFIGTSPIHAKKQLRKGQEEILEIVRRAVKLARATCDNVEFSPMDAGRTPIDFLCRIVETAITHGAGTINIPDTVGYTTPEIFSRIIDDLFNRVPNIDQAVISVHCHNDLGMATANSLTAVAHGARQVECAVNGLGERAGNCATEEVVMAIKLRRDYFKAATGVNTREIMRTSRLVREICGMPVQANKAIVGGNAFAHSSGIHQDGVLKAKRTFEIMTPQSVGLKEHRMNLTSRSGRHMVKHRLVALGYDEKKINMEDFYKRFLALADKKGTVYDDDLEFLMEFGEAAVTDMFRLEYLNVTAGSKTVATATVKLKTNGKTIQEAATGDGPVDATYNAIDRLTGIKVKLKDYKLNAITGGRGALGQVDVLVEHGSRNYHGIGFSTDIVEASALSYLNAINRIAVRQGRKPKKASRKGSRHG